MYPEVYDVDLQYLSTSRRVLDSFHLSIRSVVNSRCTNDTKEEKTFSSWMEVGQSDLSEWTVEG